MKRTASTLLLLAGLGGGGCISPTTQAQKQQQAPAGGFGTVTQGKQISSVQGPLGEPVMATAVRGAAPGSVQQAGGANTLFGTGVTIRPASEANVRQVSAADGCTNCAVPGLGGSAIREYPFGNGGPLVPNMPIMPRQGIVPVPGQGPPGAVAAGVGALMPGMGGPGMGGSCMGMVNGRSSINFTGPAGMKVTWQLPDGSFNDERDALTAPKEYNFLQGQVYRLRLTSILPDHPGRAFYPTLEVAPATPRTLTFLAHSSVPITFSADDFAQAKAGNLVVKVVYLPDPTNQDFSLVVGAEEVVSTRLEPGADPVAEAQRRGTILAIIRMGNIDLENRISPPMTAPPGGVPLPGPRPVPPGLGGPPRNSGFMPPGQPNSYIGASPPGIATVKPPATLPPLPPSNSPVLPPSAQPVLPAVPPAGGQTVAPSSAPFFPPGSAPALPPSAPSDLPPAPIAPPAAPLAPGPKPK
jgi:hypothetical protein